MFPLFWEVSVIPPGQMFKLYFYILTQESEWWPCSLIQPTKKT